MEDEIMTQQELEQETILPEGYAPEDDFFADEDWGKDGAPAEEAETAPAAEAAPEEKRRDFRGEAETFFEKHPGYYGAQVPQQVLQAWLGGAGLGEAFAQYETGRSRAETQRLQRENQVLRQNAAAAMRAPVRGVGGGGDTAQEPEDPFLKGFNDERW